MTPKVQVVRTGLANLASVLAGLRRAGADPHVTESAREIAEATHVMLPGVGAFGAAMDQLHHCGLVSILRERLDANRPTMAICLGLQLLFEESEETPGVEGLGIVPKGARRFPPTVRVPQLGWNSIKADDGTHLVRGGFAYFANSFRVPDRPGGWKCGMASHGQPFIAAMERGNLLGCQFHPELSGAYGLELLRRWLKTN